MTDRKLHMSFRLVPNSVTLDDLERRNSPNRCVISPNAVAFRTDYVKMIGDTLILSCGRNVVQRITFLVIYHFKYRCIQRYLQGITPSERVKVRHSPLANENWTITWKRCKIGGKLLLISNRMSYMSFRLVPKSATLNDLERRNGRYIALFH